jgi:manganese transport protein
MTMDVDARAPLERKSELTPEFTACGPPAWRRARGLASLSNVFHTINVTAPVGSARKMLSFFGPGYLVAVGYMDPGNWATSLSGGAKFGYALLFVALLSNLMAIVLQALCARLAIATGRDLAQACRDGYPPWAAWPLWLMAEIAIVATDIAEVIGTAIGFKLLFGIPLELGVVITALDVFLVLLLQRMGFRYLEAFVIAMLLVIAACFGIQIALAHPVWGDVLGGFAPSTAILHDKEMLFLALGVIGATVMPHNLYLHSAIVQTRTTGETLAEKREALRYATIDSTLALTFAFGVNISILILAAAAFYATDNKDVAELGQAHALLSPLLGSVLAPTLFGIALLCCGLNSTVTATLAGQVVMEGFIDIRLTPWLRRLITRAIAIVPAAAVILIYGEPETARLLILTQVVLSLQLPFAIVPLIQFTANRPKMGALVAPCWLVGLAIVIAVVIIALNLKLVVDTLMS